MGDAGRASSTCTPARLVAVQAQRMTDPMFWPAIAAIASGVGCYGVFYGAALLIERRQFRQRGARLRSRLRG